MPLIVIASILGIIGLVITLRGLLKIMRKPLRGMITTSVGGCLLVAGLIALGTAINLASYARLSYEKPVAKLRFYQRGEQDFMATLQLLDENSSREFRLQGDEWRLEGKLLKWHAYANLVGLDSHYKLDRISGRYRNLEQERTAIRTLYEVSSQPGLDVWSQAHKVTWLKPFIDARYGSATYLPMQDKAEYLVSITQSGLIARPTNPAGAGAVESWF